MGCCNSKAAMAACVDVDSGNAANHIVRYLKRAEAAKNEIGGDVNGSCRWTKTSHGSSTIHVGAIDTTAQRSCCSNDDERMPSETSETSFSTSVAVPTGGEETDHGRVSLSAYEETGSPTKAQKTRRGGIPDEDDLEFEDMASTSENSEECHTESNQPPINTDPATHDIADRVVEAFRKSSVFHGLDDTILLQLFARMKREVYYDEEIIIHQGDMPSETDCLYFVARGEVQLETSGSSSATKQTVMKQTGWIFGDSTLLFNSPHTASVVASGICILYTLSRSDFIDVSKYVSKIRMLRFLRKLPLLKSVSDAKVIEFGNQAQIYNCPKDEIWNLDPNMLYIIRKGRLCVEDESHRRRQHVFGRGNLFIANAESRYKALTEVEWIAIDVSISQQLEGMNHCILLIEEAVRQIIEFLGTVNTDLIDIAEIVRRTPVISASKNEAILDSGQPIEHLYVIVKGEISVCGSHDCPSSHSIIKHYNGRQFFGHRWNRQTISDVAVVVASEGVQLVKISHRVLAAAGIRRELKAYPSRSTPQLSSRIINAEPINYEAPDICFKDLKQHRVVGEGEFGSVRLVTHKTTGTQYALKTMQKAAIRDNKNAEHVIMERKVLTRLANRNFLVSLQGAYQDETSIYFLMDWVPGGELFSRIIDSGGRLPESHAVFYAANVILAYDQMHALNIIYRDLKPENMLIDKNGYLKLADYGFATLADGSAWTVCGTPDYQAPEIISRQGASKASDFWALGVLIFEMLTGDAPFKSPADDRWDTHRRILSGRYHIPEFVSQAASDLITLLLQVKPEERLGYEENDLAKIKTHPWFKRVKWDRLECQRETAPFVPTLLHGTDTSCFDFYDSPRKSVLPRSNNFFDREYPWSNLWSWIEEF